MSKKLNIEELAKEKLGNYTQEVPTGAWSGVKAKLDVSSIAAPTSAGSAGFITGLVSGVVFAGASLATMNLTPYGGLSSNDAQLSHYEIVEEQVASEQKNVVSDQEKPLSSIVTTEIESLENETKSVEQLERSSSVTVANADVTFEEFAKENESSLDKLSESSIASAQPNENAIDDAVSSVYSSTINATPIAGEKPLEVNFKVDDVERARWSFGDGSPAAEGAVVSHSFENAGSYEVTLIAQHKSGKIYQDHIKVEVAENEQEEITSKTGTLDFEVPNVFTPNMDGVNDVFEIQFKGEISTFEINVFNSSGRLVYKSNNPAFQWNGTELDGTGCPAGTYFYQIKAVGENQNVYAPKGSLTINL